MARRIEYLRVDRTALAAPHRRWAGACAALALLLVCPAVAPAQDPPAPVVSPASAPAATTVPHAVIEAPQHDFGDVWAGDSLAHTFTIANSGDAPLRIIRVQPSCGCTAAGEHPREIAPGQSGQFPFKVTTRNFKAGKFSKRVTVHTNDPKAEQIQLSLAFTLKQLVEVNPPMLNFGRVQPDTVISKTVTITNQAETDLQLALDDTRTSDTFKSTLREVTPGRLYEVTVTAGPPYRPKDNRFALVLTTNQPKQPTVEIVCMATLPTRFEVRPEFIDVPASRERELVRLVQVVNNSDRPVSLLAAGADDPNVSVDSAVKEAGRRYDITVRIPADFTPPDTGATVLIKTDDPQQPELRVPLRTVTRPRVISRDQKPAMNLLGEKLAAEPQETAAGDTIQIGGAADRVRLLIFYASWCARSRQVLPTIESLHAKYADQGLDVVAVNEDVRVGRLARTPAQSLEHYRGLGLTMPLVMDEDKKLLFTYKVDSYPTVFLVGRTGVIEAVHVGAATGLADALTQETSLLLAGRTRADFPPDVAATRLAPASPATGPEAGAPPDPGAATPDSVNPLPPPEPPAAAPNPQN